MGQDSWASSDAVRKVMQANRSRDTKPELAVRRVLHGMGLRYRVARPPVIGSRRSADLVFTRLKIVVFIDGCFWHGCPEHYREPKSNFDYWREKVRRNRERDIETSKFLRSEGWTVLRYWSHENAADVAEEIAQAVATRRQALRPGA